MASPQQFPFYSDRLASLLTRQLRRLKEEGGDTTPGEEESRPQVNHEDLPARLETDDGNTRASEEDQEAGIKKKLMDAINSLEELVLDMKFDPTFSNWKKLELDKPFMLIIKIKNWIRSCEVNGRMANRSRSRTFEEMKKAVFSLCSKFKNIDESVHNHWHEEGDTTFNSLQLLSCVEKMISSLKIQKERNQCLKNPRINGQILEAKKMDDSSFSNKSFHTDGYLSTVGIPTEESQEKSSPSDKLGLNPAAGSPVFDAKATQHSGIMTNLTNLNRCWSARVSNKWMAPAASLSPHDRISSHSMAPASSLSPPDRISSHSMAPASSLSPPDRMSSHSMAPASSLSPPDRICSHRMLDRSFSHCLHSSQCGINCECCYNEIWRPKDRKRIPRWLDSARIGRITPLRKLTSDFFKSSARNLLGFAKKFHLRSLNDFTRFAVFTNVCMILILPLVFHVLSTILIPNDTRVQPPT